MDLHERWTGSGLAANGPGATRWDCICLFWRIALPRGGCLAYCWSRLVFEKMGSAKGTVRQGILLSPLRVFYVGLPKLSLLLHIHFRLRQTGSCKTTFSVMASKT